MPKPDLDQAARDTLRLIGPDPQNWVPDRDGVDHNVVVVGGAHSGSAFAFALRRAGIGKVAIIDAAQDAAASGIWLTTARMHKLRTPKALPGPELGLPGLSFQSWYEARHGEAAYSEIDRIPRVDWAAYLDWYRSVLNIPVQYGTRLLRIEPVNDHLKLHIERDGATRIETTRKVVLANGFLGAGGPHVPEVIESSLPPSLYAHTSQAIDFTALRGKSVAVVGSAASAFDAAAAALESGATQVHLFARRHELASLPVIRIRGYPGAYDNYGTLPDAIRWHQAIRFKHAGSTPPPDAIARAVKHRNFHLHLSSPWSEARTEGTQVIGVTRRGEFKFDFVIAGTGFTVDARRRPELADFADEILLWRDRFKPPADEQDEGLGAYPYLRSGHEYLERRPGQAPLLRDIHVFNPAAFVSYGLPVGDIPSFRRDIPGVVARISRDLFLADLPAHEVRINGTVDPDFNAELYASAIWRGPLEVAAE
ncbi:MULTISPECIES: NAD(P)-binding domain-containing protein [unclassified Bradyrhizobium]|uniref:NAD(P)-binding domain-containing protein n=1 Tax=unclassified Bradyrhizobium TaxID=2631580 RepID=UPI002916DEED|nr:MULTISPECIES: NAD(P)-binding domain-containing protein [unclassified Bradyrhizobium]